MNRLQSYNASLGDYNMKVASNQLRKDTKEAWMNAEALMKEVCVNAEALKQEATSCFNRCFDLQQKVHSPQNYVDGSDKIQ